MARELSPRELDELLGAYALDAVDDDERAQVEAYLDRTPAARSLVAQYRETAALLSHGGTEAPAGLWERIARTLEEEPPRLAPPAGDSVVRLEPRRARFARRVAVAVGVAAAAVAVCVLTVKVVQQGDRIDELDRQARTGAVLAAAETASRDPNAVRTAMSSTDGTVEARVVYLPDGDGFLVDDNLRALPADRTYQLWALMGDVQPARAISAGVLGPDPGVTAFRVQGPVVAFAITDEQAPGVASTSNAPVVQGTVH
ncbi:MAG TPA: anti-sigma factor [Acidimicrobiia bacterium]|nr:anti-sigma factor [Acidimicrobiia bacterium]